MLHLRFSNRAEALLEQLDSFLQASWTSLEASPQVVVPSPSSARWLKLRLCERSGPLVGLDTPMLEAFLWKALEPDPGTRMLRAPVLQQALLGVLNEALLAKEDFAPVRTFLERAGAIDSRRRVQLCQELARLFLEYEYNRPSVWGDAGLKDGLERVWPERPYFAREGSPETPSECWQRQLHGRVFAADGPLADGTWLGLPRLYRLRKEAGWRFPEGPATALFLVDKMSHFHRNALEDLARSRDLHVFLLNPCAQFWEDLDTSRRRGGVRSRPDRFEAADWEREELDVRFHPAGDPLLLERWGRAARENIALWFQAAGYDDFEEDYRPLETAAPTLLESLQESLLQRHSGPLAAPLTLESGQELSGAMLEDGSLRLLATPERGREMEAVRDQILSWLAEDPSRGVDDAVVYLPDPERHRVEIHRIFGGLSASDPGYLPYAILGEPAGESLWARGARALLSLAEGSFDRPGVFALLRNPLCRARLKVDATTEGLWEAWAEGSGMIRGWDAEDRTEDAVPLDTHTFRAGLLRLLLAGQTDGCGVSLGLSAPGREDLLPPWSDFDSRDRTQLENFATTLERLHLDLAELRRAAREDSPSQLGQILSSLFDAWLDGGADPREAGVRRACLEQLEALSLQEAAGKQQMDLAELSETVLASLDGELPGSPRAWTGVLTFAPLKAGNILPHGLVVIPGLDADAFPQSQKHSTLDLLAQRRIVGDADLADDDRHAFLLSLLSARSRLVLTWLDRDIQKDEQKDPSSLVQELESALDAGFLDHKKLLRRVRLLAREAPTESDVLTDPSWDPLDAPSPFAASHPHAAASVAEPRERVSLSQFARFLTNPWSHRILNGLGAREEELPDTLGAASEVLESSALDQAKLRSDLFPLLLRPLWEGRTDEALEVGRNAHRRFLWNAGAPEGALALRDRAALETWIATLSERVTALREEFPEHCLKIGCDLSLFDASLPCEPEIVLADSSHVKLAASIPAALLPKAEGVRVLLSLGKTEETKAGPSLAFEKTLEPRLWSLALRLTDPDISVSVRVLPRFNNGPTVTLPSLNPDLTWLSRRIEDLFQGACPYLPAKILNEASSLEIEALRETLEERKFVPDLERLLEPRLPGEDETPGDLKELIAAYWGPFLGEAAA